MTNFEDSYRYILMKDTPGMKAYDGIVGVLKKVVGVSASKTVNVPRGELLVAIPPSDSYPPKEEGQRDYCLERDPTTILRLLDEQCVTPLGPDDFRLLKAVESPFDRFRVFVDENWLEWGEKVYVGNEAFVRLPGPNPTSADWARVIIQYKGPVKSLSGTIFGVEIVEKQHRGKGSTDGMFHTHMFFRCEDNCGLFVSLEKLYFSPRSEGTQGEMQHKRSSFPGSGDIKQSYARVASQPHDSRHEKNLPAAGSVDPRSKVRPRFKMNDRVIVYDKDNIAYHGTVHWVGRKNRIGRDLGAIHVGIETDVFVASTDVPGAKTGLTDIFGGKKNYSIVVPEMIVAPEEACARENKGQQEVRKTAAVDPPIDIDMNDPVAMARNYGMTKRQFMAQQEQVLKEAEMQKKKKQESSQSKEMKEVKQALGESINVQSQQKLLKDIRGPGDGDDNLHPRKLESESQSSFDKPGVRRQRSLKPPDHVYDAIPVKDDDAIAYQGKSSSIAQGDGISQSFEREGYSKPPGTIPASPQPGQQHHHRHDEIIYMNVGGGSYSYDPQHIPQQEHGYGMVTPQQYYVDQAPHQPGQSTDHAVHYPGKSTDQVPYQPGQSTNHAPQQPNPERGPPYDVYNQPGVVGDPHHPHGFEGGYLPQLPGRGRVPTSDAHLQPGFDRASASQDVRNEPGFEGDPASRAHVQPGSGRVSYDDPQKGRRGYVNVDDIPTEPRSQRFIGERGEQLSNMQPSSDYYHQYPPADQWQYPPAGQQPWVNQWQQQPPADHWQSPPAGQQQYQPPADHWQQPPVQPGVATSTIPPGQGSHMQPNPSLSIGSRIQVATKQAEEPFKYGVIRWIGEIPQIQGELAGIELDDYMEGCTDGLLVSTGQRFFSCDPGRGLYYPLVNLQPDVRDQGAIIGGDLENQSKDREVAQLRQDLQKEKELNTELQLQLAESKAEIQSLLKTQEEVLHQEKESSVRLKEQLTEATKENSSLLSAQQESIAFGIEPWKVSRNSVEVGRMISGGGWGVVSEGKLHVAVKQFYPNILSEIILSRLKREMRMLTRVRHPNLLQFIAVVFDDNGDHERNPPYIITELLDRSLRSAYENKLLRDHSLLSIFQDTARALDYLHRRHEPIIHRDVSSANVLLKHLPNDQWVAKLSDLGSANLAKEAYTMNEGARVYCAPEAFTSDTNTRSAEALTPQIDVYSYGIVLCEVATRTFPDREKFPEMLNHVRREWPQLYQLVVNCTNSSPEKRPSMASVLSQLEALPPKH